MFSAVIRDLRLRRGMTQKELAQAVFLSPSAISQYENGTSRPSRETLDNLALFFDVSVSYLLGSSVNTDIEARLSEEFCNGMSMSELLSLCTRISQPDRPAFLRMVYGLTSSCAPIVADEKEKVCR